MISWENIKEKVYSNTKQAFQCGNPKICEKDIIECIDLLKKLILHNTETPSLNGLSKVLIPALQDAYISNIGDIGSLRIIADSLEPFLKKLCISRIRVANFNC